MTLEDAVKKSHDEVSDVSWDDLSSQAQKDKIGIAHCFLSLEDPTVEELQPFYKALIRNFYDSEALA